MEKCIEIIENAEKKIQNEFKKIEAITLKNQEKVLEAFRKNKVGMEHFYTVSGYGHDDMGRDVIDKVFADGLHAQSAIVEKRIKIINSFFIPIPLIILCYKL